MAQQTALDKMRAIVAARTTDQLLVMFDQLDTMASKGEAEKITLAVIGGELTRRQREAIKGADTGRLVTDYLAFQTRDYSTFSSLERMDYRLTEAELEDRFPAAEAVADAWLDTATAEDVEAAGPNSWALLFLSEIGRELTGSTNPAALVAALSK